MLKPKGEKTPDIIQLCLMTISKFIENEKPDFEYQKELEKLGYDYMLEPKAEDSTELGEVPHSQFKGSIRPGLVRRLGYGFYYMYENKER